MKEWCKEMKKTQLKTQAKQEYLDCYYMTEERISIWELYDSYQGALPLMARRTQIWSSAGVIELELGEKNSVDIEILDWFTSESDLAFLDKYKVQTIFGIHTELQNRDVVLDLFRVIQQRLGGFICSDTQDFQPFLLKKILT